MIELMMVSGDKIEAVGIMVYVGGKYEMVSGSKALEMLKNMFLETSTLANMKYLECIRYVEPKENQLTEGDVDTRCFINLKNVESIRLVKGK